jgi:hypothetical protein
MFKRGGYIKRTKAQKDEVINYYRKNNQNMGLTTKHFKIKRQTIENWLKKGTISKKNLCGRKRKFSESQEEKIFEEVISRRIKNQSVNTIDLKNIAKKTAKKNNIDLKVSNTWIQNFKKRYHLSIRKGSFSSKGLY